MAAKGQWIAIAAIVAALGGALLAGMTLSEDISPVRPGSEAPHFEAVDVFTGDTVPWSSYRGEVVLLNVWATWCAPCEREMPSMQRLHERLGPEGLKVVAVSVDGSSTADVRAWVEERKLSFNVLHVGSGRIERLYQTTGVPESFVIDRDGIILRKEIGPREWDQPENARIFQRLLGFTDEAAASAPTDANRDEREDP